MFFNHSPYERRGTVAEVQTVQRSIEAAPDMRSTHRGVVVSGPRYQDRANRLSTRSKGPA